MKQEKLNFVGEVVVRLSSGNSGELLEERHIKNLVVDSGLAWAMQRFVDLPAVMSHMAVGSGPTPAVPENVTLENELVRTLLISSTVGGPAITYIGYFPVGVGTGPITEAGIFNAENGGTLLARTVFPVVNKGPEDVVSITWTITVSEVG